MPTTVASALSLSGELVNSDSARLHCEILLAMVLDLKREQLLANPQRVINQSRFDIYKELLARRKQGEPVAYLTGRKAFWDFELQVNASVLIPRPETELLVEQALTLFADKKNEALQLVDLGTGSGALAIALARASSRWQVCAVDISADALEVARDNAVRLGVSNIEFYLGSWCEPLQGKQFDLLVANPPYVAPGDSHLARDSLPFEPSVALVAAENGLADIESICRQASNHMKENGCLLLEHGYDQQGVVIRMLEEFGYKQVQGFKDLSGVDRAVVARWPGDN
ncbi:MAG: peptide chain release factor N(5)-glutamine methyltransferase [Gammaproteobacteria bacterium]